MYGSANLQAYYINYSRITCTRYRDTWNNTWLNTSVGQFHYIINPFLIFHCCYLHSNWLVYVTNHTLDEPEMMADELCVSMYHSPGRANLTGVRDYNELAWGDEDCSETNAYICKYPAGTRGETTYHKKTI